MSATEVEPRPEEEFELVVGLEIRVPLRTRSKLFCGCATRAADPPNVNACPICLALPGALPVLNLHAVELAVRTALGLDCVVHPVSVYERIRCDAPDEPKGYSLVQRSRPLASGGRLQIGRREPGTPLEVRIAAVRLGEEGATVRHLRRDHTALLDFNRAGHPSVQLVTEPDMRSGAEAVAFLHVLRQLLAYLNVSETAMDRGGIRVNAHVSARGFGETALRPKSRVLELRSAGAVARAISWTFSRHTSLHASGARVEHETLRWDDVRGVGTVVPARDEVRAFGPDPDLPPLVLDSDWLDRMHRDLPERPAERRHRFLTEYRLAEREVEVLTASPGRADYFEGVARRHGDAPTAARWVTGEVLTALRRERTPLGRFRVRPADLATLLNLLRDGVLSDESAREVFRIMARTGQRPEQILERPSASPPDAPRDG